MTLCAATRADDVHLDGDRVIEGKAVRHDDKVTIELESGSITLSAEEVRRIEPRESSVQRYERLYAALKPNDVEPRMALADYCRDHGMRERERHVLEEVIEREPDHAAARARLGYIHTPGGWVTREQDYRARGLVQFEGEWMSPEARDAKLRAQEAESAARRERARAEEQEKAQLALEKQRLALEAQQLQAEQQNAAQKLDPYGGYYGYGAGYYYGSYGPWPGAAAHGCGRNGARCSPQIGHYGAFPIPGVRDPRDPSFNLPGFRDPKQYLRRR